MNNKCESGTCIPPNTIKDDKVMDNTITVSPAKGAKVLKMRVKTTTKGIRITESNEEARYYKHDSGEIDIAYTYKSPKGKTPVVTITPYDSITEKPEGSFTSVSMARNDLDFISFTPCKHLESLDLSHNHLTGVFMPTISNVKVLDLQDNPILNLETVANMCDPTKQGLQQLETLNIKDTSIQTLILTHCENLKEVFHDTVNKHTGYKVIIETPLGNVG